MSDNENVLQNTFDHLSNYYDVNLIHLKWSFWASVIALCVGLVALLTGVYFIISGSSSTTASLTTIGGVLTQFIGAGFFTLYSKNLKQLNVFYEKLIKHQDTEHAVELIKLLPDELKAAQISSVISILITRNEPPLELTPEKIDAIQRYSASK
jgi:hypothetical protein